MDPFERRHIGRTGVWVTCLGLGGTAYAGMYNAVSNANAVAAIKAAYAAGIRYFDTAPLYGHGSSEERLGSALSGYQREEFIISTKVGRVLEPRPRDAVTRDVFEDPLPFEAVYDFTYEGVMRSFEDSLKRLRTDCIDIVLIHDPDQGTSLSIGHDPDHQEHLRLTMNHAYRALTTLRAEELVKAIGVGMNQWEMLYDFARLGDFDCLLLAGRYTLLDQGALTKLLPLCEEKHISIIIGGPYNSGILATGAIPSATYNYAPAPPDLLARTAEIEGVCRRHGIPLQAAALQFPFSHPAVATVIPGGRSVEEVRANLAFFAVDIPPEFWTELKTRGLVAPQVPVA